MRKQKSQLIQDYSKVVLADIQECIYILAYFGVLLLVSLYVLLPFFTWFVVIHQSPFETFYSMMHIGIQGMVINIFWIGLHLYGYSIYKRVHEKCDSTTEIKTIMVMEDTINNRRNNNVKD